MPNNNEYSVFTYNDDELDQVNIVGLCRLQETTRRLLDFVDSESERPCFYNQEAHDYYDGGELLSGLFEGLAELYGKINAALLRKEPMNPDDAERRARAALIYELEGNELVNVNIMLGGVLRDIEAMSFHKDKYDPEQHSIKNKAREVLL